MKLEQLFKDQLAELKQYEVNYKQLEGDKQ